MVKKSLKPVGEPWLYTVNRALAPVIPIEFANLIARPVSDIFYAVFGSRRAAARRNYSALMGLPYDDPAVDRMAKSAFRHFGRYVVEMMHMQGWSMERLRDAIDIEGEEHFAEALERGRGLIFVGGHMGSAEVASAILMLGGHRVTSVAEPVRPKMVMDWIYACRERSGVTLLPVEKTGISLLRTLRRNGMVALVVDVGVNERIGIPVRFFGREVLFPVGPARLARMSGAPIIFGLAIRKRALRYRAYISPPMYSDPTLDADQDARRLTQRVVDELERFVRQYPNQWYIFRDLYLDGRSCTNST